MFCVSGVKGKSHIILLVDVEKAFDKIIVTLNVGSILVKLFKLRE